MTFNIIHPSIVDLYIHGLYLGILQERLSETGPDGMTDDIEKEVNTITSKWASSADTAQILFGSTKAVQAQLDYFSTTIGKA